MEIRLPHGICRRLCIVAIAMLVAATGLAMTATGGRAGPALVFDTRTGTVLHSHGAFTPWHPASLTKLMTAYVTFQAIEQGRISLQSPVRVSEFALSQPPSKMGFPVGTELSIEYALRILMVKSANDIAVAVAESVGGTHDGFISRMNAAARRLGMSDTAYVNPHGLHDPRQRTTARDLALLTRALIREFPQYQRFFEIESIRVGQKTLRNHNKLIGRFRGANGMKTGYVCASGFNIVATATRDGRRLAAIVLGGKSGSKRNEVTAGLLEAAFAEGGGFSLISAARPKIGSLHRPASIGAPVDLRPYICGKKKMPAEFASFGVEKKTTGSGGALALAAAPVNLGSVAATAAPLVAFDVPLPRPRPSSVPIAEMIPIAASAAGSQSGTPQAVSPQKSSSQLSGTYPRPNPMR